MSCDISILLATYNRAEVLAETLEAFCALDAAGLTWEVLVVDNNSTDNTSHVINQFQDRLPIVPLFEGRQGKNVALNQAIDQAAGRIWIFTDDDVTPPTDWLKGYLLASKAHPDVAVFAGPVDDCFPADKQPWLGECLRGVCGFGDHHPFEGQAFYTDGQTPVGANFALNMDVLSPAECRLAEDVGPRGSGRVAGGEGELLLRLQQAGRKMLHLPGLCVQHRVGPREISVLALWRRAVGFGRGNVRLCGVPAGPELLGLPRYLWPQLFFRVIATLGNLIVRRKASAMRKFLQAGRTWGVMRACRQLRTIDDDIDVAFVNDAAAQGGAEYYQLALARALQDRGYTTAFICPPDESLADWRAQAAETGAKIITSLSPFCFKTRRRFWRDRPRGVVHFNGSWKRSFVQLVMNARSAGRRVIFTEHLLPPATWRGGKGLRCLAPWRLAWRWRALNRWIEWKYAQRVIAVSGAVRRGLIADYKLNDRKSATIYNGVDIAAFGQADSARDETRRQLGMTADEIVIGTTGRLELQKDYRTLLEAFAKVEQPGVKLLIVGDGPELQKLQAKARKLGIEQRVTFAGWQDQVRPFLAAMDIFVLSSVAEAMPFSILEAMAAGRAVVATDVGGVAEAVEHGVTGLVVQPSDPDELADAIAELVESPEKRDAFGQAGRERIDAKFSQQAMIDATLQTYRMEAK